MSIKSDVLTSRTLSWLTRDYPTLKSWQKTAIDIFLASNGNSELSRQRLAAALRSYFLETSLEPVEVTSWDDKFEEQKTSIVDPPKLSVSNIGYVAWLQLADYLLLAAGGEPDTLQEENQTRSTNYQMLMSSFTLQTHVYQVRRLLQNSPQMTDEEILEKLLPKFDKLSIANIKEAKRRERDGVALTEPTEPGSLALLSGYNSL